MKFFNYIRNNHATVGFWTCTFCAIALMTFSIIMPPKGVIDSSVIMASGELFAFAALAVIPSAIKEGKSVKVSRGDTSVEIGGNEDAQD